MTQEFIYNIGGVFGIGPENLLKATGADNFYIGPYQRGYKWASRRSNDPVPQLLSDIEESVGNRDSEYYLQYITVKIAPSDSGGKWLEVIDGQQRLTTLSLFFYCLAARFPQYDNIAENQVIYSRFNGNSIFDSVIKTACESPLVDDENIPEQDRYYLVKAARCIMERIDKWNAEYDTKSAAPGNSRLDKIVSHVKKNVKIIVNIESNFVSSEEIFANLNDNHVPLTDAYLVKGLIITNALEFVNAHGRTLEYEEIQSKRRNLGREWDIIQSWASDPVHSHFFFRKTVKDYNPRLSMEYFLKLAFDSFCKHRVDKNQRKDVNEGDMEDEKEDKKDFIPVSVNFTSGNYDLFNLYNSEVRDTADALEMMGAIRHVYNKLRDLYESDNMLYNLFGYALFGKQNGEDGPRPNLLKLLNKSKEEQLKKLKEMVVKRIPDLKDEEFSKNNYERLGYASSNPPLTDLLLSLSVFKPLMGDPSNRFPFYTYEQEKWSFEHIMPQNPQTSIKIDPCLRRYVEEKVKDEYRDEVLTAIDKGEKVDANKVDFLYGEEDLDVDSFGNMALLTRRDNSANSNNPFAVKRQILMKRRSTGSFIPSHTFEAFNKIMVPEEPSMSFGISSYEWNQEDVDAHISSMVRDNKDIINWIENYENR